MPWLLASWEKKETRRLSACYTHTHAAGEAAVPAEATANWSDRERWQRQGPDAPQGSKENASQVGVAHGKISIQLVIQLVQKGLEIRWGGRPVHV